MQLAEMLRAYGGNFGLDDADAAMELSKLALSGSTDLLQAMTSCGTNANAANCDGRTALHVSASEGSIHIVRVLIAAGAN
eukprot:4210374-Pleurochrysis_carterae.AAC.1